MINEIEMFKKYKKQLNAYCEMLIDSDQDEDYILGKIKNWTQAVNTQAKYAYEYKKEIEKGGK